MRTCLLSLLAAATVASTTLLTARRADAMTVGTVSSIQAAIKGAAIVEDVRLVCTHRAWSSRQRCREVIVCRHRAFSSRRVCR